MTVVRADLPSATPGLKEAYRRTFVSSLCASALLISAVSSMIPDVAGQDPLQLPEGKGTLVPFQERWLTRSDNLPRQRKRLKRGAISEFRIPLPVPWEETKPDSAIEMVERGEVSDTGFATGMEDARGGEGEAGLTIEPTPEPFSFRAVEKDPECMYQELPEYPDLAKRIGIEGTVVARLLIEKDGRVGQVLIQKSDADIFLDPVRAAASRWRFLPATAGNVPVKVWMSVPFQFRLSRDRRGSL